MAELTQGRDLSNRRPSALFTERFNVDTSVARSIYRGQPVILDKSVDTVNIVGWVAAVTLVTAADVFIGIANENITVAAGDLEVTKEIDVITDGEVGFQSAAFTDADVGKTVVFTDSGTLAVGTGSATQCTAGKIARVANGYVYVQLTTRQFVF
ncbi:MAG: hypothetical protein BWZ07_03183 [Alphaproteobacteria bacterium ADurb.BinA280]|nr:MAG: hypothetical protein BWZ07_03183 [Alphaproteobacteria bacterium ADurb.BinA280]